jgi:uncharacterized protein (TIRG00374 family)
VGVAIVAFGLLLYFERDQLADTWDTLLNANLWLVLLLPFIQIVNYFLIGQYYRKMFANFGTYFSRKRSWGVVAAMNFVNQVLPSGGLSGITYLAYGFRTSLETGKTTLIQLGRYVFAFGAYAVLGPLALLLVVIDGNFNEFGDLLDKAANNSGAVATMVVFILIAVVTVIVMFNQSLSHKMMKSVLRILNWFKRNLLRRKRPIKLNFLRKIYKELNEGVGFIKQQGIGALKPAFYMLLSAVAELAIVYVSLLAIGQSPEIGIVFISFVAANIVGVVSIIPGDVGVHEATMIITLSAFGIPESAAISATLLYRVFNKVIFLPIGLFFYTRILKPATEQ